MTNRNSPNTIDINPSSWLSRKYRIKNTLYFAHDSDGKQIWSIHSSLSWIWAMILCRSNFRSILHLILFPCTALATCEPIKSMANRNTVRDSIRKASIPPDPQMINWMKHKYYQREWQNECVLDKHKQLFATGVHNSCCSQVLRA